MQICGAVTTQVLQGALELLATMLEQSLDKWGADQLMDLAASLAPRAACPGGCSTLAGSPECTALTFRLLTAGLGDSLWRSASPAAADVLLGLTFGLLQEALPSLSLPQRLQLVG